jgi:putative spermidine/putrescine transport system permease protein
VNRARRHLLWLALPSLCIVALFLLVFLSFASVSLMHVDPGGAVMHGPLSLANYERALGSIGVRQTVLTTIRLAFLITLISVLAGYPLAYVLARSPSSTMRLAILLCLVATFLSGGVTRAYAWTIILGNRGLINLGLQALGLPRLALINNETGVVISVLNFILPFFVLTLFGAIRTIPVNLEQAAQNLGASRGKVFRHVTLPLSLPGLAAASSLAFALSLGAFLFPQLLGGGRVQVMATLIYERILSSYDLPSAAALSVLFLLLVLFVLGGLGLTRRLIGRRFGAPEAA